MASIHREIQLRASADAVWQAARDPAALHTRLVPGFVIATEYEAETRTVTFFDGSRVREQIVSIDDERRRIAWNALDTPMTHYNASFEVHATEDGCIGRWIADLLPHEAAPTVAALMERGLAAMQRAFEPTFRPT